MYSGQNRKYKHFLNLIVSLLTIGLIIFIPSCKKPIPSEILSIAKLELSKADEVEEQKYAPGCLQRVAYLYSRKFSVMSL